MTVVNQMEALARRYHEGQTRKDGKTPYVVHPEAVVSRLRNWGVDEANGDDDTVSLAVAWGHDLLEDTVISEEEILAVGELGKRILAGIKELTFVRYGEKWDVRQRGPRNPAKERYIEAIGKMSAPEILLVKISDRLCNARDFVRLYRYDKAQSYVRAGNPLFVETSRVRGNLRDAVDRDVHKTMAEIDQIVKEDEAWERMSGGAGYSGSESQDLVGFVRMVYDRSALVTDSVSLAEHCRSVVKQLYDWGCDEECDDNDGISIALAWCHALWEVGGYDDSELQGILGDRADRVGSAMVLLHSTTRRIGMESRVGVETFEQLCSRREESGCYIGSEASPEVLLVTIADALCHVRSLHDGSYAHYAWSSAALRFKIAHQLLMRVDLLDERFRERVRKTVVEVFERVYFNVSKQPCVREIEEDGSISRLKSIAECLEEGFDSKDDVRACRDWTLNKLDEWGFDRTMDLLAYCAACLRHSAKLGNMFIPSLSSLCGGYAPDIEVALRAFEEFDSAEAKHLADWHWCDNITTGVLAVEIADRVWWLRHAIGDERSAKAFVALSFVELEFLGAFLDRFEECMREKIGRELLAVKQEVSDYLGVVWEETDAGNAKEYLQALWMSADMFADGDCDDREIKRIGKAVRDMELEGLHYSETEALRRADELSPEEMDRAYCYGLRASSRLKRGFLRGDLDLDGKSIRCQAEAILEYEAKRALTSTCAQDREWATWFMTNHK